MKFQLTTAVWGPRYTERFLTITLPSLLASGNIPGALAFGDGCYTIYTRPKDAARIRQSEAFRLLSNSVASRIFTIRWPWFFDQDPIRAHWNLWHRAIARAKKAGEWIAFVSPDSLWGDGALTAVARQFENGKSVCYGFPLRVVEETVVEELTHHGLNDSSAISIAPRRLTELALRHLSPLTACYLRHCSRFGYHPEWLVAAVKSEGIAVRAFVAHCLAVDPARVELGQTAPPTMNRKEEVALMTDSDEFVAISLTPLGQQASWYYNHARSDLVSTAVTWAKNYIPDTLHLWNQSFHFHCADRSETTWRRADLSLSIRALHQFLVFVAVTIALMAKQRGLTRAAQVVAAAVQVARLHRFWRVREPITLFVPSDAAFDRAGLPAGFASSTTPAEIRSFLFAHVGLCAWNSEQGGEIVHRAANGRALTLRGGAHPTVNGCRVIRRLLWPALRDLGIDLYEIDTLLSWSQSLDQSNQTPDPVA